MCRQFSWRYYLTNLRCCFVNHCSLLLFLVYPSLTRTELTGHYWPERQVSTFSPTTCHQSRHFHIKFLQCDLDDSIYPRVIRRTLRPASFLLENTPPKRQKKSGALPLFRLLEASLRALAKQEKENAPRDYHATHHRIKLCLWKISGFPESFNTLVAYVAAGV